jgi:23S rRNA (guanosine2251-2'-O)-methyltransferase
MKEWIAGRNPVFECLRAGRRQVFDLRIAQGVQEKGRLAEIIRLCDSANIPKEYVPRQTLDQQSDNHQGVMLQVSAYPYRSMEEMLALANDRSELPFLLLLDTLQDPQNLGALLRTAEIVGVHGVLLPLRQTATVTPAVVSASSGASEHLLVAQTNLAQAIEILKKENVWVIGLDEGPRALPPEQVRLDGSLALIVGNEGSGMRRLVAESCDMLLRLPMRGRVGSLNAAVAGSVALYFAWQARGYR